MLSLFRALGAAGRFRGSPRRSIKSYRSPGIYQRKGIFRTAGKMTLIVEDPAEDLLIGARTVKKPKIAPQTILELMDDIPYPRNRALLALLLRLKASKSSSSWRQCVGPA